MKAGEIPAFRFRVAVSKFQAAFYKRNLASVFVILKTLYILAPD